VISSSVASTNQATVVLIEPILKNAFMMFLMLHEAIEIVDILEQIEAT
jgi:hypothetical protein